MVPSSFNKNILLPDSQIELIHFKLNMIDEIEPQAQDLSSELPTDISITAIKEYLSFWQAQNTVCGKTDEDIIAFIGPTKAGKSTLINCLMKKRLISKQCPASGDCFILKVDKQDGGPSIGKHGESESVKPKCYGNFGNTDLLLWDFPGFGDNKGVKQEVANAISVKTVLGQQRSVRFILVVAFETMKSSNPLEFFHLLNSILSISSDIAKHLVLVASKMDKGNLKKTLNKLINTPFPDADPEQLALIDKAKSVIKVLLENGAYVEFKSPQMEDDVEESVYQLPNIDVYEKVLLDTVGVNTYGSNMILSNGAKVQIVKLHDIVYSSLSSLIDSFVENSIDFEEIKKMKTNQTSSEFINIAQRHINELKDIQRKSLSLIDLLTNIGADGRTIEICNSFEHLEALRNNYGDGNLNGAREFYLTLMKAINHVILMLNNEITKISLSHCMITDAEKNEMESIEVEAKAASDKNKKGIGRKIYDFCVENSFKINIVLGLISLAIPMFRPVSLLRAIPFLK